MTTGIKEKNVTKLDEPLRCERDRFQAVHAGPRVRTSEADTERAPAGIEVPWPALLAITEREQSPSFAAPSA